MLHALCAPVPLGTPAPLPRPGASQAHKNWVLVVAWSPDAQYVASGDMDGTIHLWDPKSGKLLGTCSGHGKWITSIVSGGAAGVWAQHCLGASVDVPARNLLQGARKDDASAAGISSP